MKNRQRLELESKLNTFAERAKVAAMAQFEYNWREGSSIDANETAQHAFQAGLVSAASLMNDYDVNASIELAVDILSDVNAHTAAATLQTFIE